MKVTLNALVVKGVTKPKVCGVHCESENIETYVMDISSPRLYRLTNASEIKLFKNLDRISLLPNMLCLKGVAVENATKIETAALYSLNNLKRQASDPPVNWLSNDSIVLFPKETKEINHLYYTISHEQNNTGVKLIIHVYLR